MFLINYKTDHASANSCDFTITLEKFGVTLWKILGMLWHGGYCAELVEPVKLAACWLDYHDSTLTGCSAYSSLKHQLNRRRKTR